MKVTIPSSRICNVCHSPLKPPGKNGRACCRAWQAHCEAITAMRAANAQPAEAATATRENYFTGPFHSRFG